MSLLCKSTLPRYPVSETARRPHPPPRRALSRGDEDEEEEEEETLKLLGTLLLCIEVALLTDGMQKELGRESRSE